MSSTQLYFFFHFVFFHNINARIVHITQPVRSKSNNNVNNNKHLKRESTMTSDSNASLPIFQDNKYNTLISIIKIEIILKYLRQ